MGELRRSFFTPVLAGEAGSVKVEARAVRLSQQSAGVEELPRNKSFVKP